MNSSVNRNAPLPRALWALALYAALMAVSLAGESVAIGSAPIALAQGNVPAVSVPPGLRQLIDEALKNSPEIAAAAREKEAAAHRILPAGALEDPMIEAGLVNVPISPLRLNREDMTMKMLGVSQRLPYPGKRGLREAVAARDAESVAMGHRETVNRVARDVKVAYYDLALADRSIEIIERNKQLVKQLLQIAEGRYSVGQGAQADSLRVQTQLAKMDEELLRMRRERRSIEADLERLVGRGGQFTSIRAAMPGLVPARFSVEELGETALRERPQLLGLKTLIDKNQKALDLARKDYYPDFDVRFQYGQRDKDLEGMPRTDLFTLTVAFNLPVWGATKIEPKIAEAQAMREQAISLHQAQQNELIARLRQQVAIAEQSRESARLYETGILPHARLALESALAAYRVNKVDFPMLLDSQMTVLGYEVSQAAAVVAFNKALAEIDQLTGKSAAEAP
jgi:cobalt-zinc-cadmium efflux system outer membrane protein